MSEGGAPIPPVLGTEAGVELQARSQWAYVRIRFLRHRLAVASLVVLLLVALVGVFASQIAPYAYDELDIENANQGPTLEDWHLFGTDQLGRDYLSRVIFGVRTSLWVAVFVALVSTVLGAAVGAVAGYYGGKVDNLLMRFTDLVLTVPGLAVLLTASVYLGSGEPLKVGLILALYDQPRNLVKNRRCPFAGWRGPSGPRLPPP